MSRLASPSNHVIAVSTVASPRDLALSSGGLLFLACWLVAALVGGWLAAQPSHPLADVTHYKFWTRLVSTEGVAAAYSGEYPETYAIYPPATMYGLWAIGQAYQILLDPSFERELALHSLWLTAAIRWMALGLHLVLGAVLFWLVGRSAGPARAAIVSGLYLLTPGALWNVAVWGQPDSWHALFVLAGIWQAGTGRAMSSGAWLGLAALTKPQAWAVLPLAALGLLRHRGVPGALRAAVSGGAVIVLLLLPFLLAGRLRDFLSLPSRISTVMPVASANAHNLWWLVTGGAFPFVLDSERLPALLPLTYRQAALLLVLAVLGFALWRVWSSHGPWELAGLAAYTSHAWFTLTAGAHENHPFMILPLLALVAWRSRFLLAILLLISLGFSFNVLAHDFGLEPLVSEALGPWSWRLQMVASLLNLSIFIAWTAWLLRPNGSPAGATRPARALPRS